ncbi:MAG: twin-arginine translocase subunit TatC [Candidatus Thermoplasmatota archaeon]
MFERNSFWGHFEELRKRIIKIICVVFGLSVFFFIFDIRTANLYGITLIYPYPDVFRTISTRVFLKISNDLLPSTVKLVALTPWDAMLIQFQVSIILGVIFGFPVIVHQFTKFIAPALYKHEKRILLKLIIPSTLLFILGCIFAYILIIPFSILFLYQFAGAMDIEQMFTVDEFISFVLLFILAFGILFQLPVIMVGLSSLGIASPDFWLRKWKVAFFVSLLFAAIITPDGTGITMLMIAFPMLGLYFIGYGFAKRNRFLKIF